MRFDYSKPSPWARRLALVPVALIAFGAIAFVLGYRLEGRTPVTVDWRTHVVAEHDFAVTAQGMLIVTRKTMNLNGAEAVAENYIALEGGAEFSVTAVRRPSEDTRPHDEVASAFGLINTGAGQNTGDFTTFRQDTTRDGTRTQMVLIVRDSRVYQLMVTAPTGRFSAANAARFFSSFRFLGAT